MIANPAHRVMAAIGAPYGWTKNPAKGVAKRRAKRKAQTIARRKNRE